MHAFPSSQQFTPGSLYEPSHDMLSPDQEVIKEATCHFESPPQKEGHSELRSFLAQKNMNYFLKAGQAVAVMVRDISPSESGLLFHGVTSDALGHQLSSGQDSK